MPIPRPKILTQVVVPTGGWEIKFACTLAVQFDTSVDATVPAGTYYMAWDYQDDCLLYQLEYALRVAGKAAFLFDNDFGGIKVYLDSANKVNIAFNGDGYKGANNDVRLEATGSSADLMSALGFYASADVDKTADDNPVFTADWQHAYGWYSDADGQLGSLLVDDISVVTTPQRISYAGHTFGQQIGERFANELRLQWLTRALTYSNGIGYGEAPVRPYARNKGLECWWREASQSKAFRVYRDGRNQDYESAVAAPTSAAATGTSGVYQNDAGIAYETEPQEHKGRLCETIVNGTSGTVCEDAPHRFFISSHDDDELTSPNEIEILSFTESTPLYIFDQRYRTYVVDLTRMREFSPTEHQGEDYYDIDIPLLRYEA